MADITVNPAAGRIGAEIEGVDISRPLDADAVRAAGLVYEGIGRGG